MKRFEEVSKNSDHISLNFETGVDVDLNAFEGTHEELKDFVFNEYLKQQLLTDFFEHLNEFLSSEEISQTREVMEKYNSDQILSALSLPRELRERRFEDFRNRIDKGESLSDIIDAHVTAASRHGYGIGYHASPYDIRPDEHEHWTIKGTEKDHRDNDLTMAYYSRKYRHLYKKKHPKFLYVVRTDPTHKTDGNWSRASSLSVIARLPIDKVISYVEKIAVEQETATSEDVAA